MRKHGKFILVSAMLLALLATPIALGAGEGRPLKGGARNPSDNASIAYTRETQVIANTATYGTRQSNKSDNGGGAIYGCRSKPGGTPAGNEPCLRSSNIADGLAFELSSGGVQVGTINTTAGGDATKPFTTNATGVATGLNADRVDSKNADDLTKDAVTASVAAVQASSPLAQVTAAGAPGQTRGVTTGGVTKQAGLGDYDVVINGDLSNCAVNATVTGTAPGQVTVTPAVAVDKKTTTVDVRTFDGGGIAADRAFDLAATC